MSGTSNWDTVEEIQDVIADIILQAEAQGKVEKEINVIIKINY
jgi:hypothetical protein